MPVSSAIFNNEIDKNCKKPDGDVCYEDLFFIIVITELTLTP